MCTSAYFTVIVHNMALGHPASYIYIFEFSDAGNNVVD